MIAPGNDRAQFPQVDLGGLEDVVVSETAKVVTTRPRLALTLTVPLPRVTGPVIVIAVELYGEALRRPAQIDTVPARRPVRLRQDKPVVADELHGALFELAETEARVTLEYRAELPGARCLRDTRPRELVDEQ